MDIDRSGLISTSGKQLMLKRSRPDAGAVSADLVALDIESGELHELVSGAQLAYEYPSPDGQTFMFAGANAASDENLFIARLLSDGVVPAHPVSGLAGRPSNFYMPSWTGDRRFAVMQRGSNIIGDGIDVIDMHKGAVHASLDTGLDSEYASAYVAPTGLWLWYVLGEEDKRRTGLARITSDGLETIEDDGTSVPSTFSRDGMRAIMVEVDPVTFEHTKYFYRELASGEQVQIDAAPDGENTLGHIHEFTYDRDHVIASFVSPDGLTYLQRHLSIITGESTPLVEPGHLFSGVALSKDGTNGLAKYEDEGTYEVRLVDLHGVLPEVPVETYPIGDNTRTGIGAAGDHHLYYFGNTTGFVVVGRDDAGNMQRAVVSDVESLYICIDYVEPKPPGNRLTFLAGGEQKIGMVDLDEPLAVNAGSIAPEHGGYLGCPIWNAEGTAFAYAEQVYDQADATSESWVYVVRWADGEPSAPELVYTADSALSVVLARP